LIEEMILKKAEEEATTGNFVLKLYLKILE
jgi:hypothetical protein